MISGVRKIPIGTSAAMAAASGSPTRRARAGQPRLVDACVFCGDSGPLTQEHVWPQWLRDEVPDFADLGTQVMGIVGYPNTWRQRRTKAFSARPKIVCATCNNGWMSDLESASAPILAPMIRGQPVRLDRAAQRLVAFWLAKTVMTARWVHRDRRFPGIPTDHYVELYQHQAPPGHSQVWVAACSHDDRPSRQLPLGYRYRMIRLERLQVATRGGLWLPFRPAYAVALSIGNLAGLVFGHTYDRAVPVLSYDGTLGMALHDVWPGGDEELAWPSGFCLNYTEFNLLISRLEQWQ